MARVIGGSWVRGERSTSRLHRPTADGLVVRSDAMSWLDQLNEVERMAVKRLKELEPYVAEHPELQQLVERLGLKRDGSPDSSGSDRTADAPRTPARARGAASVPRGGA